EDQRRELQIRIHGERGEAEIDAVEVGKEVGQHQKRNQPPRDRTDGGSFDVAFGWRGGLVHVFPLQASCCRRRLVGVAAACNAGCTRWCNAGIPWMTGSLRRVTTYRTRRAGDPTALDRWRLLNGSPTPRVEIAQSDPALPRCGACSPCAGRRGLRPCRPSSISASGVSCSG